MRTVYIHTTPDGKKYVGATHMNPNIRFKRGLGYRYQFFYQAVLEFGWENISHQLYEVDTEEELKYLERYLISYYDTTNPEKGYNITKGDATQDHGTNHPEYGKSDKSPRYKEVYRKYQTSERGKEKMHKHNTSERGKELHKKYRDSEKGKETMQRWLDSEKGKELTKIARQRYHNSEKYKLTMQRWHASEKGKESQKLSRQRYNASDKRKEADKRYREKRKNKKLAMLQYFEKKKKQTQNE